MAKIIAVFNIKGGVGKTTSAVNLAYFSAMAGFKTLLWDIDHQGSAGFFLGEEESLKGGLNGLLRDLKNPPSKRQIASKVVATEYENLDLLPSDESMRLLDVAVGKSSQPKRFMGKLLAPLIDEYDYIFIDCAPGLSKTNESLLNAVDLVLAPVIPTILAVRTLEELNTFIKNQITDKPKLRAFFTLMDSRKILHKSMYEQLCVKRKTVVFPICISNNSVVEKMAIHCKPLAEFAASHPATADYEQLWQSVKRMRL